LFLTTCGGAPAPPDPVAVFGRPTLSSDRVEPDGAATHMEFIEEGRCLAGRLHSGAPFFHDLQARPDDTLSDCANGTPVVSSHGERKLTLALADGTTRDFQSDLPVRNGFALSADGKLLAAATGTHEREEGHRTRLEVWDTSTGEIVFVADEPLLGVWRVAFSSDGRVLAADSQRGGRAGVRAWSTDTFKPLLEVDADPSYWMRGVALSPDGKQLYAGGENGVLHVYDLASGEEIRSYQFGQFIESLAASSEHVAVALKDTTIRVFARPL